jgi:voltage-gated sodium channel
MTERCRQVNDDRRFQGFIIGVIVFNAILMGVETSPALMATYGRLLTALNVAVQAIFLAEIAIRLITYWPRPLHFFRDGWNLFDFSVVVLSLLPMAGPFATVSRLARLLRVVRLVSVAPELRLIIDTMLRSIPSMGHVAALLGVLVYVYAIFGFYMFRNADPAKWGALSTAMLSVFQMLTLEGWVEMQQAVLPARPWAWIYFSSFVVVGVFIVINLFIAVVLNNLETVKSEERAAHATSDDLLKRVETLKTELEAFEVAVQRQKTLTRSARDQR